MTCRSTSASPMTSWPRSRNSCEACPDTSFVLDHLGKPPVGERAARPMAWGSGPDRGVAQRRVQVVGAHHRGGARRLARCRPAPLPAPRPRRLRTRPLSARQRLACSHPPERRSRRGSTSSSSHWTIARTQSAGPCSSATPSRPTPLRETRSQHQEIYVRAATYVGDETFHIEDRPEQPPGPAEVRIDVAFTGICGTDLHIVHGAHGSPRGRRRRSSATRCRARSPRVGDGVDGWSVGDRVTVMPLAGAATCPACRRGHIAHLPRTSTSSASTRPARCSSRWTVPGSDRSSGSRRHARLDHAALVEPTAVAVHDVRRCGLAAGRPGRSSSAAGRSAC